MRLAFMAFGLAMAASALPAGAQTKPADAKPAPAKPAADKPAAAPKPDPAFDMAKLAADALGPQALAAVQADLIWTGDLTSLATGEFGRRTYDGIRAFQKRIKGKDTGILLPPERDQLQKAAARAIAAYGFKTITAQGVTVGYPAKLAIKETKTEHGIKLSSPTGNVTVDLLRYAAGEETFEALFARLKTERPGRKITYSLARPDFFVVSGTVDGMSFYMRFLKTAADSRGFVVGWDPTLSPGFDRVPIAMAGSLAAEGAASPANEVAAVAPGETAPAAPSGPPVPLPAGAPATPRGGVGFLVSATGDVLTTAAMVAGCTTVVLGDGSRAKVIAGDAPDGPALVRLAAAPAAAPLSLRAAALASGESVALIGAGGRSETTIAALNGPGEDMRRITLASAGSGGVIDAQGELAGLVTSDQAPAALKPLFVSAFLRANGVKLATTQTRDTAPAVIGLTCTPGQ